jgi:hypothetical protein
MANENPTGTASAGASDVHGGVQYSHKLHFASKSSPPYVEVSVPCVLRGDFVVMREDGADKFFKYIGFTGRINTGDLAFEKEYALQGASTGYISALFSDANNREVIRALFALGYDKVELSSGTIAASQLNQTHLLALPVVTGAVEQMTRVRLAPGMDENAFDGGISLRNIQSALIAGMFVSILLITLALSSTYPLAEGWWGAILRKPVFLLAAFSVFFALLIFGLRGRPDAHRVLGRILWMLPLILPGCWSGIVIANQALDTSVPTARELRLLGKYSEQGKENIRYHFEVEPWRPEWYFVHIEVSEGISTVRLI